MRATVEVVTVSMGGFVAILIWDFLRGSELSMALGRAILGVLAFFGGSFIWLGINTVKSKLRPK